MTVQHDHCSRDELLQLLIDEAHPAEQHVLHCEKCQSRLTQVAGDEDWWSGAHDALAGDTEERWQPDSSWTVLYSEDAEKDGISPYDLAIRSSIEGLLDAPRHPEMLGRLGRYEVEGVIGYGGMGAVLKAHDGELNRPVALKVLAAHLAHVGAARQRFAREGRAAAAVVHDHVVAVHNVETHGDAPFLVMQYVPGQSLQARVDRHGPLALAEVLRIGMQAAAGLAAAHAQGLVHRDVKPSNILLENGVERALLTDFGLARAIDDASLTRTGVIAGTPHYMSPEQACGEPVDPRSDLFGLGAVLYFMCTGRPPFRAANTLAVLNRICHEPHRPVWQIAEDALDELSDLIDKLLEKKPGRRPASAVEVQHKLAAMLSRHQQHNGGRRRYRLWRTRRMRRRLAWAGAALLAASTMAASAYVWTHRGSEQREEDASAVKESASASFEWQTEFAAGEQAFVSGVDEAISLLDSANATPRFDSSGDSNWSREIASIHAALDELEYARPTSSILLGE